MDVHQSRDEAFAASEQTNRRLRDELDASELPEKMRASLSLRIDKRLQSRERLANEEQLILAQTKQGHREAERPALVLADLPTALQPYQDQMSDQLATMPYLKMVLTGTSAPLKVAYRQLDGAWSRPYLAFSKTAETAIRARIANGLAPTRRHIGDRPSQRSVGSFCLAPISSYT